MPGEHEGEVKQGGATEEAFERLRAERDALARRAAELEALVALLDVPVARIDPSSGEVRYLGASGSCATEDDVPWRGACGSRAEADFRAACRIALSTPGRPVQTETTQVLLDRRGVRRRFTSRVVAFRDPVSGRRALLALARDVSPLCERDARLRLILKRLPSLVWATDEQLRILTAEGQVLERLGLLPEEAVGLRLDALEGPFRPLPEPLLDALRGALKGSASRLEVRWGERTYEVYVEPLRDSDSEEGIVGTLGLALDVTEQRSLREQIQRAQKIDALGRLVGEVAHDFNNLLTAILGHAAMASRRLEAGHPALGSLEEVRRAGERAADLTRQLLAFSRRQVMRPVSLDICRVVERVVSMVGRVLGEHIVVRAEREDPLPMVCADEGQLEQVLVNLAVNARDAMPNGGMITFRCQAIALSEAGALRLSLPTGRFVVVSVQDTGEGMDAETMAHIFEPFFTTKEHGTGLGLATAYGIVAQSGGRIEVESVKGEGTTFHIYLPACSDAKRSEAERVVPGGASPQEPATAPAPRRVLLAEDDEGVRRLVTTLLSEAGYEVVAASDGTEALRLGEERGPIDVLVSDILMPGMDGPSLAERLRDRWPGVAVIFVSGHPAEKWPEVEAFEPSEVLSKPFAPVALLRAVRAALRQQGELPVARGD